QRYPGKKPSRETPVRQTLLLLLENDDSRILLEQRPPSGLWGGLWCPPQLDSEAELTKALKQRQLRLEWKQALPAFRHTFSHFHLDITPLRIRVRPHGHAVQDRSDQRWVNPARPGQLG